MVDAVALSFHVPVVSKPKNAWMGCQHDLILMMHAAQQGVVEEGAVLVEVEEGLPLW